MKAVDRGPLPREEALKPMVTVAEGGDAGVHAEVVAVTGSGLPPRGPRSLGGPLVPGQAKASVELVDGGRAWRW